MFIYFSLILMLFIIGLLHYSLTKNKLDQRFLLITISSLMIIIATLRKDTVGTDTASYIDIFNFSSNLDIRTIMSREFGVDKGYLIYNNLLSKISLSPIFLHFVNYTLITSSIAYFIKKNSNDIFFSFFSYITLYYYCVSLNITRQFIVISIFIFGYEKLKERKQFIFIILIVISYFIHKTALVYLPVLFLERVKPTYKNMIIIFIVSLSVGLIIFMNPNIFLTFFDSYSKYQGTMFFESRSVKGTMFIWALQILCYFVVMYLINRNDLSYELKRQLFDSSVMVLLAVIVGIMGTKVSIISRIVYYFDIFMIILIPNLINNFIKEKTSMKLIVMVFLVMYFIYKLSTGGSGVYPYKFFWQ